MAKRNSLTQRVLKATGIFGGTQVITILCALIRSKLVAIWIGPAGFGLLSIYLAALDLLGQITSLGVRSSAVRDVATNANNREHVARISRIIGRWGIVLGLGGLVLTALISPLLSLASFGTTAYFLSFVFLGIGVALNTLTGTNLAILQGLSRLKNLSHATIGGAVAGLVIVIPMYYYWRLDSILPSIIVYAVATFLAAYIYRERFDKSNEPISRRETISVGRKFLALGFFITISDILGQLAVYIFVSWLNINAGEDIVGLYQAGNTLFNRYVGLVFTAIAMEYYPRLTAVVYSPKRVSTFVSHEIKMALSMLVPIVCLFAALAPLIIKILYAAEFISIVPFVTIAITGTTLRAVSWCMAMVILARGDGKRYILTEGSSAIIAILVNIVGYKMMGLIGLGLSYVAWYLSYTIIVYIVYRRTYGLTISRGIYILMLVAVVIVALTAAITLLTGSYIIPIIAAIATTLLAIRSFRNH